MKQPNKEDNNVRPEKASFHQQLELKQTYIYNSVLPPPEVIERMEKILSGAADRLLTMAEEEAKHRRDSTEYSMQKYYRHFFAGQIFAFIVSMTFIIGVVTCALENRSVAGLFLGAGALSGIIGAFLWGSARTDKNIKNN